MGLKYLYLPSGVKAGTAYGVMPNSADADFDDFTRNSTASRIGKNGFIESVGSNVPRLDYSDSSCPSLLLEPQRINDLQRSQEFDNAYWTKYQTSVSANSYISPDGTLNSDKLIENNSNSIHQLGRAIGYNSGTTYTVSLFAKSSNRNLEIAAGNTNTFPAKAIFDLSNGTVLSSTLGNSSIENYGNGWYRCIITATALATATTNINFGLTNGSTLSYAGDGVSFIELFGAMREQGSFPTSYIPTFGSDVTRSADIAGGTGDLSDTFNSLEGVLYIKTSALSNDLSERRFGLSDGTSSNVIRIGYTSVSNRIIAVVYNGSNQAVMTYTSSDITQNSKIAVKYKQNDFALWVNGVERSTDTSGSVFSENTLNSLDFNIGGGSHFYSKTKDVRVYNTALTDIDLEELTSWDSFRAMAEGQNYVIE